jgi:hypothetical protein
MDDVIEQAKKGLLLHSLSTEGEWMSTLGSGEIVCTAIMSQLPDIETMVFIADFLPDWVINEKYPCPKNHVPNMKFIEWCHKELPNLLVKFIQQQEEINFLKERLEPPIL